MKKTAKYILLTVALMAACKYSEAQFYSKRIPLFQTANGIIRSIQVVNDTVYAMCGVNDTVPPYKSICMFAIFNKAGDIVSRNVLDLPQRIIQATANTLIKTRDGGFAYCASDAGASSNGNLNTLLLLKYDHFGNLQWYREITDSSSMALESSVLLQDSFSNLYLTGIMQHLNYDADGFIAKTDGMGHLIYYKVINNPGQDDEFLSLSINTTGAIIFGGITFPSLNFNDLSDSKAYFKIGILDTAGNLLNIIVGTDSNGPSANNGIPTSDGGLLTTGNYYCARNSNHTSALGSVVKFDSSFHEVWRIDTGACSVTTLLNNNLALPDGNYLTSGIWNEPEDTNMVRISGWLVKYSGDGHVLWSKEYDGVRNNGNAGYYNGLSSIGFFSDSTIICAGESTNNSDTSNSQKGWLLHLDKNGCLPDSNSCGIVEAIKDIPKNEIDLKLFPNPASQTITVSYSSNDPETHSSFEVYNVLGQSIYETKLDKSNGNLSLDVRQWTAGIYSYRCISEKGNSMSSSFVVSHD